MQNKMEQMMQGQLDAASKAALAAEVKEKAEKDDAAHQRNVEMAKVAVGGAIKLVRMFV